MQPSSQSDENQALHSKWTFYEAYQAKDFTEFLPQKVISFSQVNEAIEIFAFLPLLNPTQLLSQMTQNEQIFKLFSTVQNPQQFLPIDSIFLFRGDIYPTWEDKKNEDGSILHFTTKDSEKLDACWSQLCCMLISENLALEEIINGIRIMEKMQQSNREFRIQIWFGKNFSINQNDEAYQNVLNSIKIMFNYNQLQYEEKGLYPNKK